MADKENLYVETSFQKQALRRLRERLIAGEDLYEILGIRPNETYYVNKLVSGKVPMSYIIYDRIMGCSIEDASL